MSDIRGLLFSLSKEELLTIRDNYKEKVPEPLTHQFPDRISKDEAVKCQQERKKNITELFPRGKIEVNSCYFRCTYCTYSRNTCRSDGTCYYSTLINFLIVEEQTCLEEAENDSTATGSGQPAAKKTRVCRKCGNPMKGHPRSRCPDDEN